MALRALILLSTMSMARAQASEIAESFSTRTNFSTGTAVWNQALGKVHPGLRVMNYNGGATLPFDVGDGSHGSFDVSTYANFSVGGDVSGNKIRFDTTTYPVLKVTSFHLASGWVLEPVGTNPLIIYSLSDIRVEGEIWCQGRNGGAPVGATPGSGGIGRCGGMSGGNGGAQNTAGSDGASPDPAIGGGVGGTGLGVSGGGGGSWNLDFPATASANAGAGGGLGASSSDPEFTNTFGGAGGGGGAGSAAFPGAGGGSGGGTVVLHAVGDINIGQTPTSVSGFIFVNGGNGGTAASTGGAGGGGGGGGVQAFSGATINIFSNSGAAASDAGRGSAGTNGVPAAGGLGCSGRSWFSSVNYNGVGFYSPSEESTTALPGNVEFTSATQTVTSHVFDLQSSSPTFSALSILPASTDFLVEASGSSDNFVADDTGWTTSLSTLANKQYLKFRISVSASNVNTPDMVDSLRIEYTAPNREDFNFQAAGCGRIDKSTPGTLLPVLLAFLMLLAARLHLRPRH